MCVCVEGWWSCQGADKLITLNQAPLLDLSVPRKVGGSSRQSSIKDVMQFDVLTLGVMSGWAELIQDIARLWGIAYGCGGWGCLACITVCYL